MEPLLAELVAITGPDHVITDSDVTDGYTCDWTRRFRGQARCVVRPASAGEVSRVVSAVRAAGVREVPRGGSAGLVGSGVPWSPSAVLVSLRRLNRLDPVDVLASQVTAQAGVTIADLRAHAAAAGLEYGVDLAARASAT